MLEASSGNLENIFEILLGNKKLKWDPFWNFLHWLCLPDQGHGLGADFQKTITEFAFGEAILDIAIIQEFRVDPGASGSGKWADLALAAPRSKPPYKYLILMDDIDCTSPNDSRKINNLAYYSKQGQELAREGSLRLLVITNTRDTARFEKLRETLGAENEGHGGSFCWSILPLPTIGNWIEEFSGKASIGVETLLDNFISWCKSM